MIKNYLSNYQSPDYKDIVRRTLEEFKALGCNMSLKVLFLHSHLDVSKKQGESFIQDIKKKERMYQKKLNIIMLANYGWMLHLVTIKFLQRKGYKRYFQDKRKDFNFTIINNS